jgi:hypothetical protein
MIAARGQFDKRDQAGKHRNARARDGIDIPAGAGRGVLEPCIEPFRENAAVGEPRDLLQSVEDQIAAQQQREHAKAERRASSASRLLLRLGHNLC